MHAKNIYLPKMFVWGRSGGGRVSRSESRDSRKSIFLFKIMKTRLVGWPILVVRKQIKNQTKLNQLKPNILIRKRHENKQCNNMIKIPTDNEHTTQLES